MLVGCETAPKTALTPEDFEIAFQREPETGALRVSTAGNQDFEHTRAYDNMTNQYLTFWIEAVRTITGEQQVYVVGDRLRFRTEESLSEEGRTERIDVKQPAWVGPSFREADLQLRWRDIRCPKQGGAYFCNQRDRLQITLTEDMIASIMDSGRQDFPVAIDRRTNVDWRVPKAELVAVLMAMKEK